MEQSGEGIGIPTPTIDAVISLYNIIHETDWRERGSTVKDLGLEGMDLESIKKYVKTGKK